MFTSLKSQLVKERKAKLIQEALENVKKGVYDY
jgi:hypothetical protein